MVGRVDIDFHRKKSLFFEIPLVDEWRRWCHQFSKWFSSTLEVWKSVSWSSPLGRYLKSCELTSRKCSCHHHAQVKIFTFTFSLIPKRGESIYSQLAFFVFYIFPFSKNFFRSSAAALSSSFDLIRLGKRKNVRGGTADTFLSKQGDEGLSYAASAAPVIPGSDAFERNGSAWTIHGWSVEFWSAPTSRSTSNHGPEANVVAGTERATWCVQYWFLQPGLSNSFGSS